MKRMCCCWLTFLVARWWHLNALLMANNFIYLLDVSFTFRAFLCDIKISHTTPNTRRHGGKQNAKVVRPADQDRVSSVWKIFSQSSTYVYGN